MRSIPRSSLVVFTAVSILLSVQVSDAGTRYRDKVFSSADTMARIPFGASMGIGGSIDTLFLDFYAPHGDTLTARPLVICIHGGSLKSGTRADMDSYCRDFARRGYVAATIDYRLGIELPEVTKTILEALLRGVQDTKAAVRFFRANAAQYGVDTTQIYLEGSSAGSMVADHYAYWDESEIPSDVDQATWGDIEGTSGNPGHTTAVQGVLNYCGALVDPHWINAGDAPFASIDGLDDTVVPQDSGVSGDFGIMLYGGISMSRIASPLGIYNQGVYFPGQGHGGGADSVQGFASNFFYTLMVLASSSPSDFTSMSLLDHSVRVFRYDSHSFFVTAVDKNANTVILPHTMIQYSCNANLGTITSYGLFTPSDHADSGYVVATFNGTADSCFVKTYDFAYFVISPRLAVIDTLRTLTISVALYDADSVQHDLPITDFSFTSTDPSVGTISSTGTFTAKKPGTTNIIASFGGYSDTSTVRVEIARGLVSFDAMDSLSGWTFTGSNLDSLSVTLATDQKSEGSASFKVHYAYTYDPSKSSYYIYLNKELPVYGIPDSLYLDVKSDGRNHRLYYRFSDANGNLFRGIGKKYLNNSAAFDAIDAPLTGMSPLSGVTQVFYPLTFQRIEIQLAGVNTQGTLNSGTLYVDNLVLKYPGSATGVESGTHVPFLFRLDQNYPNPFNPSTTIQYQLPARTHVVLKLYDLLGRDVRTLVDERQTAGDHRVTLDASRLASGVYFYRLEAGTYRETRKLLLLK